ncbi:MAG: hypothetical protein OXC62_15385 [Aestuariivita sp.]|nr:hypothetical protein [Aestuariivita sp.]
MTTAAFFQRARALLKVPQPNRSARAPDAIQSVPAQPADSTDMISSNLVTAVAPDGTRLVGGLTWDVVSGAEAPALRRQAPAVLRMEFRRAKLSPSLWDAQQGDLPGSLLVNLATNLIAQDAVMAGTWVFITEIPAPHRPPRLWVAIADLKENDDNSDDLLTIVPRPQTEHILDTADEALALLQREMETTEIAGLAVRWLPEHRSLQPDQTHRGAMIEGFSHVAQTVPLCDVNFVARHHDHPHFVAPKHIPLPLIGWGSAAACALFVGFFGIIPFMQEWLKEPPPAPPDMITVQPSPGAFGNVCLTGLTDWWPRIVGWDVQSSGCALTNHVPKELALPVAAPTSVATQPLVIWRQLRPTPGRNTVLAQSAAHQAIGTWPHEIHRTDTGGLVLYKTAELPFIEANETTDFGSIDLESLRSQLAILWAHAPDSVRLVDREMTISEPGTPRDVFERVARIPLLMPLHFSQPGNMMLTSVYPRQIPMIDFKGGK